MIIEEVSSMPVTEKAKEVFTKMMAEMIAERMEQTKQTELESQVTDAG